MCGGDALDRPWADFGEDYALKHFQAFDLSDFFPVFKLQPFSRDGFEGGGVVLLLFDAKKLSMSGRVDALLHQVSGFDAFFACF
ncbi:hypothetical protein D3C75_910500 [compost metagenome]